MAAGAREGVFRRDCIGLAQRWSGLNVDIADDINIAIIRRRLKRQERENTRRWGPREKESVRREIEVNCLRKSPHLESKKRHFLLALDGSRECSRILETALSYMDYDCHLFVVLPWKKVSPRNKNQLLINVRLHSMAERLVRQYESRLEESGVAFSLLIPGHSSVRQAPDSIAKSWRIEKLFAPKRAHFIEERKWYQRPFSQYFETRHQCEMNLIENDKIIQ
eukprot:TRINITY_DN8066_c0_g1_i1.p1 TRINITY_DN8066_c0_g1~~TRINITY_DN8066_c0_g1_i1.p1  ORF type:complete len:222 (+),score=23.83 TRINITY_DN8066_c0_g1_i1:80-745(+)